MRWIKNLWKRLWGDTRIKLRPSNLDSMTIQGLSLDEAMKRQEGLDCAYRLGFMAGSAGFPNDRPQYDREGVFENYAKHWDLVYTMAWDDGARQRQGINKENTGGI